MRSNFIPHTKEEMENAAKGLCIWCGKPRNSKFRRLYCSDDCAYEWMVHHNWDWMRRKILFRDHYKCASCEYQVPEEKRFRGHGMVVDHIKPVAIYPDLEYEESNLQVLCSKCNKIKTRHDVRKIRRILHPKPKIEVMNPLNIGLVDFENSLSFRQLQLTELLANNQKREKI